MFFTSEPLTVGSAAPAFRCQDDRGETLDLHALRGTKVVLLFYPADNTPTCTAQLCELRDSWEQIEGAGATVVGINSFGVESHASFREKHHFPFRLLADKGKRIAKMYRASGLFVVSRTVYVIDEQGVIRYAKRGKPPVSEILAALGGNAE